MNNEDKIYELLEKIYVEVQETRAELQEVKVDLKNTKTDLNNFREETNSRFDTLENKIDDNDAKNADRHVTIIGDINNLSASLSKLEIVTADNWSDIARLKARKRKTR